MLAMLAAIIPGVPDETVLGPYGLVVVALVAVGVLWRAHEKGRNERIADLKAEILLVRADRDTAIAGWREQTAGNKEIIAMIGQLRPVRR